MAYFSFTNKLIKGQTIEIFNYGNCKRDFTYVDDIVEGVKRVMQGPFDDGAFDTVFSVESLYFWPDALAGLKEIRRVLAPGGVFMTALEMVGGMMNERQLAIVEHLKMFCPTRAELADLMTAAGFEDVNVDFDPAHVWLCATGRN